MAIWDKTKDSSDQKAVPIPSSSLIYFVFKALVYYPRFAYARIRFDCLTPEENATEPVEIGDTLRMLSAPIDGQAEAACLAGSHSYEQQPRYLFIPLAATRSDFRTPHSTSESLMSHSSTDDRYQRKDFSLLPFALDIGVLDRLSAKVLHQFEACTGKKFPYAILPYPKEQRFV